MSTLFGQANRINASGIGDPRSMAVPLTQPTMRFPPKPRSDSGKQSQLPSLCQVIAMFFCYKRLAYVVLFLPCICAISPVMWNIVFAAINWISGGFGAIVIVMTIIFCTVWYSILKQVAPSPEKLRDAYAKSQVLLPLVMFLLNCCLVKMFARLTNANNTGLQWTPPVSWGVGLRPAFGFLLMGAALLLRFVGHGSYGKLECIWRLVLCPNSQFAYSEVLHSAVGVERIRQCTPSKDFRFIQLLVLHQGKT
jgi:hypothetical protein